MIVTLMGKVSDDVSVASGQYSGPVETGEKSKKSGISSRRRRSFDATAWNTISKLRNVDQSHKVAAEHLRAIHQGEVEVNVCLCFLA